MVSDIHALDPPTSLSKEYLLPDSLGGRRKSPLTNVDGLP
jgi:hypothetical protein